MDTYTIIEGFERSKFYAEFRWKRFEKQMRPFLAIALVCWLAWMFQMIVATGELASNIVYYLY